MFERPHHQRIALVLSALNGPLLCEAHCLFGGGTAMALHYGEYRESVDIDFLVSSREGFRQLRQLLTSPAGIQALCLPGQTLRLSRELRADQYGLRMQVQMGGQDIKLEIVLEGRIELAPPGNTDLLCGVATLCPLDMAASKLLANADRWADDSVFSRDVIDLAMMGAPRELLLKAVAKAELAYGAAVLQDLAKAIQQLGSRPGRLERCMQAMGMTLPKAQLWQKVRALARILPKPEKRDAA